MNKERETFINELNNYVNINIQKEPMIIFGNDGVGKTLTLQLYTLLDLNEYQKIYFNLKLFDKCNPRDYFLIELMRGFTFGNKETNVDNFKNYIQFVKKYQDSDFKSVENIFKILTEILLDLYDKKSIIIIDQFNFEKIDLSSFNKFKNQFPYDKGFKLILCCNLNDDKNKINLFSDYKNIKLLKYLSEFKETNNEKNNNKEIKEIKKGNEFDGKGTFVDNFYLIKKRKRELAQKKQTSAKNNKIKIENNEMNKIEDEKTFCSNKNENKIKKISLFNQKSNFLDVHFPTYQEASNISFSNKKLKIYYSNLISLEEMLMNNNESIEIIACMSEFNFLPKYYYKFNIFKIKKNLEEEKDISNIIKSFYEEEMKNIENNITLFYSKMNLNRIKEYKYKNNDANIYQNLLNLKKCIAKTYENPINFPKLYKYSLIFPFKYINIQFENEKVEILFDENLKSKKFKLRYSFPLVEKVIDKMIEEYDTEDKININNLSGSSYGNALERKIRENLNNFKHSIEVRKVWSLNKISARVKKEIIKEINKEKKYHKISRYNDLEDIVGIKELKGKYFYFKPENQNNKLFDSIFLINMVDQFYMISIQIIKDKEKRKVKTKKEYSEFLERNIKEKFNEMYGINISKIFFWYILGNEIRQNEKLCKYLDLFKIKYAFYSISNKCFYKERNNKKIDNLEDFQTNESKIYPNDEEINDDNVFKIKPTPEIFSKFENILYNEHEMNNNVIFENIREQHFYGNYGPKIRDELRKNIIKKIKDYVPFKNDFKLLFLFSFPFYYIKEFKKFKENNELIYLLKVEDKIYILFLDQCFEINIKNNSLEYCNKPKIDVFEMNDENYNKNVFDLRLMKELRINPLIFLYKIYYLGDELLIKD